MRSLAGRGLAMVVLCPVLLFAACGGGARRSPSRPAAARLVVHDYKFPPLAVRSGAKIDVVDEDGEPHTVTSDTGAFDVGPVPAHSSMLLTAPRTPGSYPYHCRVHSTMHGTLVVR